MLRRKGHEMTAPARSRLAPLSRHFFKLGVLGVLCGPPGLSFGADEFTRASHYSARLFSTGTLVVQTRTGDIRVEGWDEPRVEIEAEKVAWAQSEAKAGPLFDRVEVEVKGADQQVRLRTLYPPRRPWRPFRGETKLSVSFRIKMPYDASLTLQCVDGDVRVRGVVGRERLRVNYGDVEIDVPSAYRLRSLQAHAWLGYVQSDLRGEDSAGLGRRLSFWNSSGDQDISIQVRMGGVYVFSDQE
jgi:hypothetical protein